MKTKYKVGDVVYVDGYIGASMAQQNAHMSEVTEVATRYNEITGKPFQIVKVGDDWYREDGTCYSKESMYYIEKYDGDLLQKKKDKLDEYLEANKGKKILGYDPLTFIPLFENTPFFKE
jgi:hypothetical protein